MTQETFQNTIFVLKDEMFRFAKRYVVSSDEAQDVVQELMMKLWQKKGELSNLQNIKSYILKSVRNECLNRLKHEEVKQGFAALSFQITKDYSLETNNLKELIINWIQKLPEKQKSVIHLKDVEEYEINEIADILEMKENAVRINLMRARQKIKEQITQLMKYETISWKD